MTVHNAAQVVIQVPKPYIRVRGSSNIEMEYICTLGSNSNIPLKREACHPSATGVVSLPDA